MMTTGAWLGIFVLWCTSIPNAIAVNVPAEYQGTYQALQASLSSFNQTINAKWNGSRSPHTIWSAELLTVNVNLGATLLFPQVLQRASNELNALRNMGIQGVVIPIHFPIFDNAFYVYLGATAYNANSFLAFYKNVSQMVRNAGLKLIVESHVMFGAYSSWDVAGYFATLDLAAYTQGRISTIETVLTEIAPDAIQLQAERTTEVMNSGQTALVNYQTNIAFLSELVDAALSKKGNCKVQVGVATWDVYASVTTDALLEMPIDSFDLHIYPIFGNNLNVALALLDKARAAGKPSGITECWLSKAKNATELAEIVAYKNAFSFFAPLDIGFIYAMFAIGNYYEMEMVSTFYSQYYFTYLDYDTVMVEGCNGQPCSDMDILALVAAQATEKYVLNELTVTGEYYKQLITSTLPTPATQAPEAAPLPNLQPDADPQSPTNSPVSTSEAACVGSSVVTLLYILSVSL